MTFSLKAKVTKHSTDHPNEMKKMKCKHDFHYTIASDGLFWKMCLSCGAVFRETTCNSFLRFPTWILKIIEKKSLHPIWDGKVAEYIFVRYQKVPEYLKNQHRVAVEYSSPPPSAPLQEQ